MPIYDNTTTSNCGIYEIRCLANGRRYVGADKAATSRVARYDQDVVAENLDGRVQRFSHTAAAARGLGLGRSSIKNILRGAAQRTLCGWAFHREARV